MKKLSALFITAAILLVTVFTSCDNTAENSGLRKASITGKREFSEDIAENTTFSFSSLSINVKINYPISTLIALDFEYPFEAPDGSPAMHSGTITIPKELAESEDKKAWGFMLYNHYTIMTNKECPTGSELGVKEISALALNADVETGGSANNFTIGIEKHRIITVAADYYGFGITKDYTQYYCEGNYNARASLEAFKFALELLKDEGYVWDENPFIINTGYSQGGQTAIAVQKLLDQGKYDFNINSTFAGSGPYDLNATYQEYLKVKDVDNDTAVVIYPVLSYNEYHNLGIDYNKAFKSPLNSKIDEWFLSKKYTREEIEALLKENGMTKLSDVYSDDLLNEVSPDTKKILDALDTVSLVKNWTPNQNDCIYLYHSEADMMVPYVNCTALESFLTENGFEIKRLEDANLLSMIGTAISGDEDAIPQPGNVIIRTTKDMSHMDGGAIWMLDIINKIRIQFKNEIEALKNTNS